MHLDYVLFFFSCGFVLFFVLSSEGEFLNEYMYLQIDKM